jgi:hypothetical protein
MNPLRGRSSVPYGSGAAAATASSWLFLLGSRFLFWLRCRFRAATSRIASLTCLTHIFDLLVCYISKLYQPVRCFDNIRRPRNAPWFNSRCCHFKQFSTSSWEALSFRASLQVYRCIARGGGACRSYTYSLPPCLGYTEIISTSSLF